MFISSSLIYLKEYDFAKLGSLSNSGLQSQVVLHACHQLGYIVWDRL